MKHFSILFCLASILLIIMLDLKEFFSNFKKLNLSQKKNSFQYAAKIMKLELDTNSTQNSSFNNYSDTLTPSETKADEAKKLLRSGISLAKEGNRAEARQMLLKVTETESDNETAWLWLASISEYPEELLVFLQNVLKINPENERALEWAKQTKTLLSKTFVQRGINASRDNQKEFAKQCFLQGIVHDSENEMAWLWLASTSEAQEEKISHLQKVLQINPNNETALSSLNAVKNQASQTLLRKANSAAIAGEREEAKQLLEEIMKNTPNLEEAWVLKAYLANEYYEKIECYQKALELNPENEAAQAGLASLQALAAKVSKAVPAVAKPVVNEEVEVEKPVETVEEASNEFHEEVLEKFEDYPEAGEVEQFSPESVSETVVEEFSHLVEETENHEVVAEQTLLEESVVEEIEAAADETPAAWLQVQEEPQPEVVNEFVYQENVVQPEPKVVAESHEELFADNVQPEASAAFVQEDVTEENSSLVEMEGSEPDNSPTQELDEEFARTADVVFSSFEQPEESLEVTEVSQEFQPELPVVEHQTVESVNTAEQVEEVKAFEQLPTAEVQYVETEKPEIVFAEQPSNENAQPVYHQTGEESSAPSYQSPYYSSNGFEMNVSEPFADTVELSYSNLKISSVSFEEEPHQEVFEAKPEESHQEVFEAKPEEAPVQEFVPAESVYPAPVQAFEHQEHSTNGFVTEAPAQTQAFQEEVTEVPVQEEIAEEVQLHITAQPQLAQCPFCEFENESQTVVCHSCQAMLSLSDLEMLLAHQGANQDLLLSSIEKMEVEKTLRDFSVEELKVLGIAHLNAKNLRKGFSYLQEASQLNPNDVVLGSKVNFLAIRLSEIEQQDNKAQENPVQSRTIMVVDDSPTVRKLISGKLEKCGHSVISAIDGMDALAKINEVIPDLILLDITMPRLDGYQVCKLIRNNEITKDIPIVMISGKDGFFDKVRGRMAGSSGYITKPFGPDTLMKTIESYLS